MPIKELCRNGGFSDATFYKWRAKFGGMQVSEAQRLRELESENAKLKRLLAEAHLDMYALKSVPGVKRRSGWTHGGCSGVLIYMLDMADRSISGKVYRELFASPYPSRLPAPCLRSCSG